MTYNLFEEVVLLKDISEKGLKKGDVATIVEHHSIAGGEGIYVNPTFAIRGVGQPLSQ